MQNNEGNTPLHVATAYTHLQAIKLLLKSGDRPHSFHVANGKGKNALDYAWNSEIKSYLEGWGGFYLFDYCCCSIHPPITKPPFTTLDYHQAFYQAYNLPNDPEVMRKFIINLIMEVNEFQDKVRETVRQLVEQKYVATHKVTLLEQAAGITDENSANNFINQLAYLQEMNERQAADVAFFKVFFLLPSFFFCTPPSHPLALLRRP